MHARQLSSERPSALSEVTQLDETEVHGPQPAFLGAAEVGRQVGLGNTETCELREINKGGGNG